MTLAQEITDAVSNASFAAWHLQTAREWCTSSKEKLENSKYVSALEDARVAMFHSELAIEIGLEYRTALSALTPTFAMAPAPIVVDTVSPPPIEDSALLLGINPNVNALSLNVEAASSTGSATPGVAVLSAHSVADPVGQCAATNELAGSDWVVEDAYQPEYCQSEDSEIDEILPEWRKLGLLIARARAIIDARIKDKFVRFTDADRYLDLAVGYSKAAEDATTWEDVPGNVEDGLFWVRTSIEAATKFLAGNDYVVKLPEQQWDTASSDEESEGVQFAIGYMALALADARVSIARAHGAPDTAKYHFDLGLKQMELACRQYPKNWDEAQNCAEQGFFFAGLAAEAADMYIIEQDALHNGADSTIDRTFARPESDYVGDEDDTIDDARCQWRELVLRISLLEAFHTVRCPQFNDGRVHMRSAEAFVVKMDDCTDWEQIPDIASSGSDFIDIAFADAVSFLARS